MSYKRLFTWICKRLLDIIETSLHLDISYKRLSYVLQTSLHLDIQTSIICHTNVTQLFILRRIEVNPQASSLKPQASSLNPQASSLNPQPSTLNPTLTDEVHARVKVAAEQQHGGNQVPEVHVYFML